MELIINRLKTVEKVNEKKRVEAGELFITIY